MKNVLIFVANGTEECEALITHDILKRAGINAELVSVTGDKQIKSSNNVIFFANKTIDEIDDYSAIDMIVLPGGNPGTDNLYNCDKLKKVIMDFEMAGKDLAAICAAPSILGKLGVLDGKQAIAHPHYTDQLGNAVLSINDPITYDNVTTASALGRAIAFALQLVRVLGGDEEADVITEDICYAEV